MEEVSVSRDFLRADIVTNAIPILDKSEQHGAASSNSRIIQERSFSTTSIYFTRAEESGCNMRNIF
jgi:hypothetical protein